MNDWNAVVQRWACCALLSITAAIGACGDDDSAASGACDPNPCTETNRTACFAIGQDDHSCGCSGGFVDDGSGCAPIATTEDGTGVDWSEAEPKFGARFRVVDIFGKGVEGAQVKHGNVMVATDATGRAHLRDLSASRDNPIHVRAEHHVPTVRSLGFDDSGQKEAGFVLVPEAAPRELDPTKGNVLQMPSVALALPADSLMRRDGVRPSGMVTAHATSIDGKTLSERAMPGLTELVDRHGRPAPIRQMLSAFRVELADNEDEALVLRPGKQATASIALPPSTQLRSGDRLSMFALDESSGRWTRQSHCEVQLSQADPRKANARTSDCVGAVPHFSTWAVGEEWDMDTAGQVGCVNTSVSWTLPAGVTAAHVSWQILECNDGECASGLWSAGAIKYLPPADSDSAHSLCGLVGAAGQDYRWLIEVDLEVDDSADVPQRSGRYYYVHDFNAPSLFASLVGADLALNQGLDPTEQCQQVCAQQTLALDLDALGDVAYRDVDGDGWYARASGTANDSIQEDCDDANPDVYPGAPDSLCSGVDNDCDGDVIASASAPSWQDVSDPFQFNYLCGETCVAKQTEIAGNLFDEDCDGLVDDMDGDDVTTDEGDCDDWNPDVNPDGAEVAGNAYDENCDGATLDRDNDGYFAWDHAAFAADLGIDPEADADRFNDCVDFDDETHPDVAVAEEVGQLGAQYYVNVLSDVRRAASFCAYFDVDGAPSEQFSLLRDRNCDGVVSDLDGDGFTVPSDLALGADNAIDCNDLDLRVIPTPADMQSGVEAMCVVPDASQLINDVECTVDLDAFGSGSLEVVPPEGCPARLGGFIETNCWMIDGTNNLCLYQGWNTQQPLKWSAGELWGACDETGGGLPDCPTGAVCAGPLPYSDAYTDYITDRYTTPLSNNTCFKSCDNPIGSLSTM